MTVDLPSRNPAGGPLANVLGPLDGARISGGCYHCDAYQTMKTVGGGVWELTVHHDDGCPTLRRAMGTGTGADLMAKLTRVMNASRRRTLAGEDPETLARWRLEELEREREAGE
jgi:hypothetical protein